MSTLLTPSSPFPISGEGLAGQVRFVYPPEEFDSLTVMLLSAMARFPAVKAAVSRQGADLFSPGAVRAVAAFIVTGAEPNLSQFGHRERGRYVRLQERVARERLPNSPEWGLALLRRHAERHFGALLARMLEWAAAEIRAGKPVNFIRRRVMHVFDIVEGIAAFDPLGSWEVGDGR